MFDQLGEILATMRRNKMRTLLTGFAVAWGIFMLIVLLGAGRGLQNGVTSNFAGNAINSVSMWPGWTSKPYKGLRSDRRITFDERAVEFIRRHVPEVEYISGFINRRTTSVTHGDQYGAWDIKACLPEAIHIEHREIPQGRFINDVDQLQRRKVACIGRSTADVLFKNGENPIGEYITVDGIAFQVIGVYETPWEPTQNPEIIIPMSTGKMLYDRGRGIGEISFTVRGETASIDAADELTARIRALLGPWLGFDPEDTSALYVWNRTQQAVEMQNVFRFVNIFLWVIGFASLMAGIVGVGNIMIVSVKERTREIGIRKAIGASPWSVIRMVILEAVMITTAAGYMGMIVGLGLVELIARGLGSAGAGSGGMTAFRDPEVGIGVVLVALAVLVASGVIAGLIPSLRATRIRPIEAMRVD